MNLTLPRVLLLRLCLASDLQALFRAYRLGQTKVTYVYRLLSKSSMEEKIYFRQVNKQAMAQR